LFGVSRAQASKGYLRQWQSSDRLPLPRFFMARFSRLRYGGAVWRGPELKSIQEVKSMQRVSEKRFGVARILAVILLACLAAGLASAQPGGPLPPRVGGGEAPGMPARPDLPDQGLREGFTFRRSTEYPNTYEIYPTNGEMFYVSDSFMRLTVRSAQLPPDKYMMVLQNYPKMIESQYEIIMNKYYPDASEETDAFQEVTVGPHQGQKITVTQDPDAGPYARVRVEGADGEVKEFSVAKSAVNDILNNPRLGVDQKLRALSRIPFPLPEDARTDFNSLERDKLLEMVSETPEVQRQEFVRMRKVFAETEARRSTGQLPQAPDPASIPTEPPSDVTYTGPETRPGSSRITILPRGAEERPIRVGDTSPEQGVAEAGGMSENIGLILVIVVVVIALALVGVRLFLYLRE